MRSPVMNGNLVIIFDKSNWGMLHCSPKNLFWQEICDVKEDTKNITIDYFQTGQRPFYQALVQFVCRKSNEARSLRWWRRLGITHLLIHLRHAGYIARVFYFCTMRRDFYGKLTADHREVAEMNNSMLKTKQHNQRQCLIERWLSSPILVGLSSYLTRI